MNIQQIREKYPQYENIGDEKLLDAFHSKYYSKMPKEEFYSKVGYNAQLQSPQPNENQMLGQNIQARHPRIANFLGKLADTDVGRATEFFGNLVKPTNEMFERSGIPEFAGGALSGAMNIPISILNTPSYIGEKVTGKKLPQLPYSDLNKAFRPGTEKELASQLGNFTGSLASGLGIGGLFGQSSNALNLRNISVFENALKGGGAGYAMAGEGNNRELGAGLGLAIPSVIKAGGKVLEPYMNLRKNIKTGSLPFEEIAPLVKGMRKGHKGNFNNRFENIWETSKKGGLQHVTEPIESVNNFKKSKTIAKRYAENPTPQLAHKYQSNLGKQIHRLESAEAKRGLLDPEIQRLKRLRKTEKKVLSDLTSALEKTHPGLGKEYRNTLKDYGVIMGPYLDSPAFRKHLSKRNPIGEKAFVNALIKEEPFMNNAGRAIPELKHRELLPEYLKRQKNIRNVAIGTAGVPAVLGTGYAGYKSFFGGEHE
jgi:hypothetical protein